MFRSGVPAIATVARAFGRQQARAVLVLLMDEMLAMLNVKDTMNDMQVAFAVDAMMEDYPYFQLDDFKLCFRNALKGRYGETYNRIDVQTVFGWLRKYATDRANVADEQSYNEHKRIVSDEARQTEGMFYAEYRKHVESLAASGDEEARKMLELSDGVQLVMKKMNVNAECRK